MSTFDVTYPAVHDRELVELLQALGANLITEEEGRARLKQIRPQWFGEGDDG